MENAPLERDILSLSHVNVHFLTSHLLMIMCIKETFNLVVGVLEIIYIWIL